MVVCEQFEVEGDNKSRVSLMDTIIETEIIIHRAGGSMLQCFLL
jgi:hypothetical protein